MIPLVNVVLPLPRSPFKSTKTGGLSFDAISRPLAMVSSEQCVVNSFAVIFEVQFQDALLALGQGSAYLHFDLRRQKMCAYAAFYYFLE
jgi:hypothetical protein